VLFRPDTRGVNLILWVAGPAMLVLGLGVAWLAFRRRTGEVAAPLTDEEEARLKEILGP
jgi:cytochrome c-type biogenesis protein CcmH